MSIGEGNVHQVKEFDVLRARPGALVDFTQIGQYSGPLNAPTPPASFYVVLGTDFGPLDAGGDIVTNWDDPLLITNGTFVFDNTNGVLTILKPGLYSFEFGFTGAGTGAANETVLEVEFETSIAGGAFAVAEGSETISNMPGASLQSTSAYRRVLGELSEDDLPVQLRMVAYKTTGNKTVDLLGTHTTWLVEELAVA